MQKQHGIAASYVECDREVGGGGRLAEATGNRQIGVAKAVTYTLPFLLPLYFLFSRNRPFSLLVRVSSLVLFPSFFFSLYDTALIKASISMLSSV